MVGGDLSGRGNLCHVVPRRLHHASSSHPFSSASVSSAFSVSFLSSFCYNSCSWRIVSRLVDVLILGFFD